MSGAIHVPLQVLRQQSTKRLTALNKVLDFLRCFDKLLRLFFLPFSVSSF